MFTNELPLLYAGITLPINAMLYYGASGSTAHKYQWQSNASGALTTYDATEATKKVTASALQKLKGDWGDNIRIYVILFRKQTQYKHLATQATTNFDYSYITNLAANTTTSGTTAATTSKPIFRCLEAADESSLNSTLTSIANDIKSWAGYQAARNVD